MATNQFVPWATGSGANAETPDAYAAEPARLVGVTAGTARSNLANTAWRQSTTMAAMIGQFIVSQASLNANDDGNITTLMNSFIAAMRAVAGDQSSVYINSLSIVGGRLQFFATSGFWQCPAGVTKARVTAQGGGGGGGGGNGYAGAGGLGGNSFEGVFDVTPGTQYACNVGAGGVAGGAGGGGAPGGNGQTTSFGPQGGTSLAAALGGTGGGSGGNPASGYVGVTGAAPGLSGIIFPHGGYELAGGGAQNGILLPNGGLNIPLGGIGGGARYSATTPFPVANGRFDANGYGGGGSGGANADPGGRGAGGLLIIEY